MNGETLITHRQSALRSSAKVSDWVLLMEVAAVGVGHRPLIF